METTSMNKAKPDIVKRSDRQSVQTWRFYAQLFSLVINLWIGVQFYLWVKKIETGDSWLWMPRPAGVEGWLPIGALVSFLHWLYTGVVNMIHPAGLVIFVVILATALLFKKGFCSWVCPVGFVSEMLGDISDKLWRRRLKPPAWLDWPLRMLKYLVLAFFIWAIVIQMTPRSIEMFIYTEYNKVADILMLRFFTDITLFALTVVAGLFLLSLVVRGFWCRYLCPYGGLLGLISLISPTTRIRRNAKTCIDCSACARACPSFIKVDQIKEVVSDECTGCMACVDSCPVSNTLNVYSVSKKRKLDTRKWAAVLVIVFWGGLLAFKLFGPWDNAITDAEYRSIMPQVEQGEMTHP